MKTTLVRLLVVVAFALVTMATIEDTLATGGDHPVHIHSGNCSELGEVVAPLSEVSFDYYVDGEEMAGGAFVGQASALPAMVSVTTVEIPLADILAGNHAINIHLSEDEMDQYIACGDIGGILLGETDLPIVLSELNDSGYSGFAHLTDTGDGLTTVTVYLTEGSTEIEETDESDSSSSPTAAEGEEVATTAGDFFIELPDMTFVVGQTYSFVTTNVGVAVHEIVLEPAGAVDEPLEMDDMEAEIEDLMPGTTGVLTWTFTEAGEYQLSCHIPGHYEAGMFTTFTVEEA